MLYGTGGRSHRLPFREVSPIVPALADADLNIVIDGIAGLNVTFAGLISPGLFQFNVKLYRSGSRTGAGRAGDQALLKADSITQANAYIPIAP